jgi:V-type H+-transporting ATPase subunit E
VSCSAYSNELNQSRLRVLKAREDVVTSLFGESHRRLTSISQDPAKYKRLVEQLMLQTAVKVGEDEIEIICRAVDDALVNEVIPTVKGMSN